MIQLDIHLLQWGITSHSLGWLKVKGLAIPKFGWNSHHTLLSGIQNDGTTLENSLVASGKVKYRFTVWLRKKICSQKPIHKYVAVWPVIINIINNPHALQQVNE